MIRKAMVLALMAAFLLGYAVPAEAITSVSTSANTAQAVIGGTVSGGMTVTLKNRSDNATATQISWSDVEAGVTTWQIADQYIALFSNYNQVGWGIQIYTDNTAADANPQFTGTGDSKSGLISVDNTTKRLPTTWLIADNTIASFTTNGAGDSVETGIGTWKWMKDAADTGTFAFVPGEFYVTVWNEDGYLWGANASERSPEGGDDTTYIYIGADFSNATLVGETFQTSKLTLELYYQ